MLSFDFQMPTRIIFGPKAVDSFGSILTEYHASRILFVYGSGSIKKSGLYDLITKQIQSVGASYYELSGVSANPDIKTVRSGILLAKEKGADFILAAGGGSVIDVAKAIAAGFYYDGNVLDYFKRVEKPKKALQIGVVLTISSAGSEASTSCVINDIDNHSKSSFNSPLVRPAFAIEDPAWTASVPFHEKACGIADMMMHSIERYMLTDNTKYDLSNAWALTLIKNVYQCAQLVLVNENDADALESLMLDSTLSHCGLTGIDKKGAFSVHPLSHAISGYDPSIRHAESITVCFLGWWAYLQGKFPDKFAALTTYVFETKCDDDRLTAATGLKAMKRFYESIGMPTRLEDVGLSEKDIPELTRLATGGGTRVIGCCPQSLNAEDVESIYRLCLREKEDV